MDNGGSPVLKYQLYMDNGVLGSTLTMIYEEIVSGPLGSYIVTDTTENIVEGETYTFITVAINAIGDSEASNEVRFVVTDLPQKPA